MGRPQRSSPIRIWRIVSACSACVLWEKFTRATSMPAATSRSRSAAPLLAGPMVQTILGRRIFLFLYIDIGGGAAPPPIPPRFAGGGHDPAPIPPPFPRRAHPVPETTGPGPPADPQVA